MHHAGNGTKNNNKRSKAVVFFGEPDIRIGRPAVAEICWFKPKLLWEETLGLLVDVWITSLDRAIVKSNVMRTLLH